MRFLSKRTTAGLLGLAFTCLLPASCEDTPTGLPEVEGYDGLMALGWNAVHQGEYSDALGYFEQAIEVDVTRAEGHLGAGISCVYLEEYWEKANDYFAVAIQMDQGQSAVSQHLTEVQIQDTLWTVFECIDPDLPPDSLNTWLALTGDSGSVWVGQRIWDYLTVNSLDTALAFRFQPLKVGPAACLDLHNAQSGAFYDGDSTASGYIYFTAPMTPLEVGGEDYYSWVMVNQGVTYNYATFQTTPSATQITRDALAGWTLLQEVRYLDGDPLQAAACSHGLIWIDPDYVFGEGSAIRESVLDLDIVDVTASAASYAFLWQKFIFSWFLCTELGYGLGLDPEADSFLFDLLELLQSMQNQ
jgi:tetratricopeptide (TPR) repeat protein